MQIKKIVSGGQTGADRAALDFAIEYGIEHGGWVPEGRKAEDGTVPSRYNVRELPGGSYPERTERNVIDSDATLIVSHGNLTGGSKLTREFAEKHNKPFLHIDVFKTIAFDAAIDIHEWIIAHNIEILNIAGPRASKDPDIYQMTYNLLETAFHIDIIANAMPDLMQRTESAGIGRQERENIQPQTVNEAVDELMRRLSPIEKMRIASTKNEKLDRLKEFWGNQVCRQFGLQGDGNKPLLEECRKISGKNIDAEDAAMVLIRALWQKLREYGHLRVIK